MPDVTVCWNPKGLPRAIAVSPTSTLPASARGAAVNSVEGDTATMARSRSGARATTRPGSSCSSAVRTVTSSAPATTWWAVRMRPELS
jgi:hypothetical protein